MFTGIIEHIGTVKSLARQGASARLTVDIGALAADAKIGDSIAVSGMCLTVTALSGGGASFDVSGETLARTTLGKMKPGDAVNLEPAMRADSRMGGHFVQGHVDGVGKIRKVTRGQNDWTFEFSAPDELRGQIVEKGSVAVDGISLTAAAITPESFTVAVIPHTFENTTLGRKRSGDEVNIETDILGKYVRRFLQGMKKGESNITPDFLERHGF
jgi:riboflavin synthase